MPTSTPQGIRLIRRLTWALIAAYISMGIATTASIVFTIHQSRQICGILNIIDSPDNPPPTTERQQRIATEIHKYRESIGCKEKK